MAAALDGQLELVCGAFSSDPARSRASGADLFLPAARCYGTFAEMFTAERALPADQRMEFVAIVTPNHLHAEPARSLLYGTRVTCFIRPEHVRLTPLAEAPPGALAATVTGLEYLGPVVRLSLEAGPLALLAAVSPGAFAALETQPGATFAVTLPPEHLMVFVEDV